MFRKIIIVYSENHTKEKTSALCGQHAEVLNVEVSGKQSKYGSAQASFFRMMCMDKENRYAMRTLDVNVQCYCVTLFAGIANYVVLCMCVPDLVSFYFSGEFIATDRLLSGLES